MAQEPLPTGDGNRAPKSRFRESYSAPKGYSIYRKTSNLSSCQHLTVLDDILAYFISFGVIATGASFIGVGWNSTTSAIWIGIGVALIVVGAISVLGELQNRMR